MTADPLVASGRARAPARRRRGLLRVFLPTGLYTRSLLIVILPMLLLQAILAIVFMERHWQQTTERLSRTVARDIAALITLRRNAPDAAVRSLIDRTAQKDLQTSIEALPPDPLPVQDKSPLFFILEDALSGALREAIPYPFWVDARSVRRQIEIRVRFDDEVLSFRMPMSRAYASNWHIFLVWMMVASLILIVVSILFLRNQIRPIQHLARAAEDLGRGREVPDFRPRGAKEVRQATMAFFAMRDRIARQIEQRTAMLAGVSHDLKTVLTRLRLQTALLPEGPETDDMNADIAEMERMLEGYLAFARGDAGEPPRETDAQDLLREIVAGIARTGLKPELAYRGPSVITARPDALKRAIVNLVTNAARFGKTIRVEGRHENGRFTVTVDDDGPGIPAEKHEDVFRPFLRLDASRNLDHPGSGLGLTIARDIARGHGGDIELSKSPLGGLRAVLHIPA